MPDSEKMEFFDSKNGREDIGAELQRIKQLNDSDLNYRELRVMVAEAQAALRAVNPESPLLPLFASQAEGSIGDGAHSRNTLKISRRILISAMCCFSTLMICRGRLARLA